MKTPRAPTTQNRLGAAIEASVDLNPLAHEVLERLIHIMVRCGLQPSQIERAAQKICRTVPPQLLRDATALEFNYEDASHILTVWYLDPSYVDQGGKPKPLPVRGPAPSIEALLAGVNPSLDLDESILYLIRVRGIRARGELYEPIDRQVLHRKSHEPTYARNLHLLRGVLRTLEHNLTTKRSSNGMFERVAANPKFPVRQRQAFKERVLIPQAEQFLEVIDNDMHRREQSSKKGERTTRLYVSVIFFEDDSMPALQTPEKPERGSVRLARNKPKKTQRAEETLPGEARMPSSLDPSTGPGKRIPR